VIDFQEILTPELCTEFERLMQETRKNDPIVISAGEQVRDVLRVLSTQTGTAKNVEPAEIHIGRSTVIPVLIDALVGDEVDPRAWIEALSKGSFDLTPHVNYGSLSRRSSGGSDKGSPGTYLPRLLAKIDELDGKGGAANDPARKVSLKTAVRILIASVLLQELRRKVAAKAAIGPAWPIMVAVNDHTKQQTHLQIDALGSDADFQKHLASVIEEAVEAYMAALPEGERPPLRTLKQIKSSTPEGVDPQLHLKREEEKIYFAIAKYNKALQAEIKEAGSAQKIVIDNEPAVEMARLNAPCWRDKVGDALDESKIVGCATRYLDDAEAAGVLAKSFPADHVALLQQMMPLAMGTELSPAIAACGSLAAPYFVFDDQASSVWQNEKLDRMTGAIYRRIVEYSDLVGPPPPGVPLDHLPIFLAAGCLLATIPRGPRAKAEWRALGMFTFDWVPGRHARELSAFGLAKKLDWLGPL
jgi:hypothetical protein